METSLLKCHFVFCVNLEDWLGHEREFIDIPEEGRQAAYNAWRESGRIIQEHGQALMDFAEAQSPPIDVGPMLRLAKYAEEIMPGRWPPAESPALWECVIRIGRAMKRRSGEQLLNPTRTELPGERLSFLAGAFVFNGRTFDLKGKPRVFLEKAWFNPGHRVAAKTMLGQEFCTDEKAFRAIVSGARRALFNAIREFKPDYSADPIPAKDFGENLAYAIELPEI